MRDLARQPALRRRLVIAAVVLFVTVWLSALISSLAGSVCADLDRALERRARMCAMGSVTSLPLQLLPGTRARSVTFWAARAAVRAEQGRMEEAQALLRDAVRISAAAEGTQARLGHEAMMRFLAALPPEHPLRGVTLQADR